MGSEIKCTARFGKQTSEGKALLETSELIFRGAFRLKIAFAEMKSVKAVGGELRIGFVEGKSRAKGAPARAPVLREMAFDLGAQAEKWAQKILHPKTRLEKLGIKGGAKVSVIGELEKEFQAELKKVAGSVTVGNVAADAEWIFLCAETAKDLAQSGKIAKSMKGAMALWIVYPKGRKDITENDVIACGRKAGWKDVKVVGFSATHTALKFVLPIGAR